MRLRILASAFFIMVCISACSSSSPDKTPLEDPLYFQQWHISNAGQTAFSTMGGVSGEDLRMTRTIMEGVTGRGIIIAILDSGLEIAHEDLQTNVIPDGSWNYLNNTTDPSPTDTGGDHGTSVAGIAAAVGFNGKGGRGVAHQASLKGFNVLEIQSSQSYIESMGGHPRSQDVRIFNMSYGSSSLDFIRLDPSARDLYSSTAKLIDGKGGIYVKSAGNGFDSIRIGDDKVYKCSDDPYATSGLTCENSVGEEENSRPEVIVVGAFNASGVKSSYSTAGPNLWISAPGGEYGRTSPAIITVDQTSCDKGYSRSKLPYPANNFETGDPTFNSNCNYTSAFNGTSSAAPNASGAIALMLQVNPALSRRDVKHILAKTARKIDPTSASAFVTVNINGEDYTASEGWITNKAGYNFHNWYGFGAVNIDAAVAMARSYSTVLPALQDKSYGGALNSAVSIPDNDADGSIQTLFVADDLTVENFFLNIAIDHPDTGEIGIEVISPQGTKSIILNIRSVIKSGLNPKEENSVILAANAFYGEKSRGTWTLKLLDSWPGKTGTLKFFGLRILGY